MLEARLPYLRTTQDPPRMKQKVKLWSRGWGPCLWTLRLLNPCPNAQCTEHLSIGSTPSSNSHHQDHYIFSRESLSTFMCHYYWVGSRSNLSTYGLPSNVPRNPIMFAIKRSRPIIWHSWPWPLQIVSPSPDSTVGRHHWFGGTSSCFFFPLSHLIPDFNTEVGPSISLKFRPPAR